MSSKDAKKEPPEVTEFQKELHNLFESRTASKSKIDKLTKLALQSARFYKNIVYCIEKFITRCVPEYKLTGLYVLDSICRTSKSIKQKSSSSSFTGSEYVGRFERNIEALFAEFCKVQEDKEKEKVKRVVDLWERSGTFTPSVTEKIKKKYFPLLETAAGTAADLDEATNEGAEENATEKAASIISSLAASLGQTSDFARSPLTSATPTSSSSSNPATPSTTDGSAGTPTSSVFVSQAPQTVPTTGALGHPLSGNINNNIPAKPADNALLAGFSDPSSALALQTLLATISQVNAAAAASLPTTGGGQQANYQSSSVMAPAPPMSGFPGPNSQDLPPVLQQLQGVLAISNQNGAFLPNNNTMVSSTVASSSFLHSDPRAGSGSVSESSSAGPASMSSIVHHPREYSGNGLGGGVLPTGLAPRDPRSAPVDPRLALQQQQQQQQQHQQQQQGAGALGYAQPPGSQPPMQAQPIPPSQQSQARTVVQAQAQQALDPRTMAHLASFLNPAGALDGVMPSRLPSGLPQMPMSMPMSMHGHPFPPLSAQGSQEGVGQGQGPGHGPGGRGQAARRDPHQLPNRPGSTQESLFSRPGEFKGDHSSRPAVNTGFDPPEVKEDPTVGADKIRVISRTLWVGGTFIPTISEQELEAIFAPKGQIATLIINQAKFNAFIKMADWTHAEQCKVELDRTMVQGEVMKVGWGCGFGPRDCFDYTSGASIIPVDRLTDTDRRWLGQSIVGGFGVHEPIRGGVCIYEPNIEPVGADGREALPRRGGGGGGGPGGMTAGRGGRGGGGGAVGGPGGFAGRGRGRGFGQMDQQDGAGGASKGRGGMMMTTMGRGRGAGGDEQHEQRVHPLPHRPPTAAAAAPAATGTGTGAGGMRGWAGKRDFPQGPGQDMSVFMGNNSGGSFPQVSHPSHSQDAEGGPRRNKKSRWE
ncbi:unnamed protein product [Mortierella alpina]